MMGMDSKRIHALLDPFPGTFDMLVVLPRLASTRLREFHSGRKIQESVVQQAEAFLKAALKEEMRGWPAVRSWTASSTGKSRATPVCLFKTSGLRNTVPCVSSRKSPGEGDPWIAAHPNALHG
jgi:hypothetical protein